MRRIIIDTNWKLGEHAAAVHTASVDGTVDDESHNHHNEQEEDTTEQNHRQSRPQQERRKQSLCRQQPFFDGAPNDERRRRMEPWVDCIVRATTRQTTCWKQPRMIAKHNERSSTKLRTQRHQPTRKGICNKKDRPRDGSTTSTHFATN